MLDMFRDRDRYPLRDMVPWAGEFAGKYLTSSVQILRLTGESGLRRHLGRFASELASLQAEDGYLGPWPRAFRLTGKAPNRRGMRTWDAWGHYHAMLGLLLWHEESGSGRGPRVRPGHRRPGLPASSSAARGAAGASSTPAAAR